MQRVHTNDEFGDWKVIEYRPVKSLCRCKCGTEKLISNGTLARYGTSCCKTCSRKKIGENQKGKMTRKVGRELATPLFRRLRIAVDNAIARCSEDSDVWEDYGARGISVHGPWLENKDDFLLYLSTLPGHDNPSLLLDRIDNDRGYEPGNLRFVTRTLSNQNRRRTYGPSLQKDSTGKFVSTTLT